MSIITLGWTTEINPRLLAVSDDSNLVVKLYPELTRRCQRLTATIDVVAAGIYIELQRYCATTPRDQGLLAVALLSEIVIAVVGDKHGEAVYNHMSVNGMTNIMPLQ